MTKEQKDWINSASYSQLLRIWRFSQSGNPLLQGEAGDYFADRMSKLKEEDPDGAVKASKMLGWR